MFLQQGLFLRGSSRSDLGLAPRGALQQQHAGLLRVLRSARSPPLPTLWAYRG